MGAASALQNLLFGDMKLKWQDTVLFAEGFSFQEARMLRSLREHCETSRCCAGDERGYPYFICGETHSL